MVKPRWLEKKIVCGPLIREVEKLLLSEGLSTVCEEARCPNRSECYACGTATFLIMGDVCTRDCRFCAIRKGKPVPLDENEPEAVARVAKALDLSHVVVTSVTRDDLPDGGASHFSKTISVIKKANPEASVEVLVPDFLGNEDSIKVVIDAKPDVFNHNVETVKRLYPIVRPGADYERSIKVLSFASSSGILTKSGFMLGLGEKPLEIHELLFDLKSAGVRMITIGQYLSPKEGCLPVERFVEPEEFEELKFFARELGFDSVASGPFVRSSHGAKEMYLQFARSDFLV